MFVPLLSISSQEPDYDLATLKEIFNSFEKKVKTIHGYKFSSEAQSVMGWWFYDIYAKKIF